MLKDGCTACTGYIFGSLSFVLIGVRLLEESDSKARWKTWYDALCQGAENSLYQLARSLPMVRDRLKMKAWDKSMRYCHVYCIALQHCK